MNELFVNNQAPDDMQSPVAHRHPSRPQRCYRPRGQRPSAVQVQLFHEQIIEDRLRNQRDAETASSAARAQPRMVLTYGAVAVLALTAGFLTFGQSKDTADVVPQIVADAPVGESEQSVSGDTGPSAILPMIQARLSQPIPDTDPIIITTVSAEIERFEQPIAPTMAAVSAPFVCDTCLTNRYTPQIEAPTLDQTTDVDGQGALILAAYSTDVRPPITTPLSTQSAAPDELPFVPRDTQKDLQAVHAVYLDQICLALSSC